MIDLKLNSGRILATFQSGSFSVNDLLNHLRNSSPKTFLDNPIQAFYFALRDKIKLEHKVTVYDDNLDCLFLGNTIQN